LIPETGGTFLAALLILFNLLRVFFEGITRSKEKKSQRAREKEREREREREKGESRILDGVAGKVCPNDKRIPIVVNGTCQISRCIAEGVGGALRR